jgi:hypothetical protein
MECQIECQAPVFDALIESCFSGCYEAGMLYCDGKIVSGVTDMKECVDLLTTHGVPVEQK